MSKDNAAPQPKQTPAKTLEAAERGYAALLTASERVIVTCKRSGSELQQKAAKEDDELYRKHKQSYLDGWSFAWHRFPVKTDAHNGPMFDRGAREGEAYIPIAAAQAREERMKEEQFARLNGQ